MRGGMDALRERVADTLLPPVVALLVALVAGDVLILSVGQSPAEVYALLLRGTWGNAYGFGQVLYKTTTLICTGLCVSVGLRAGLFNIGGEGQLAAGGFAAALAGLALPASTPAPLGILVCTAAAVIAGGITGWVPGVLRARFGAHEVITTIMLNFIILALLNWAISSADGGALRVPETLHTRAIRAGALPRFGDLIPAFHGSAANLSLLIALIAAAAAWWYFFRTRAGYDLRAVGLQPDAAEYGGVNVGAVWVRAMTISAALAGLGGINFVLGYKHYYEDGFATGAGFLGIAVALVGRNTPLGVGLASLFFATLSQGGLAINALVPKTMVDVLQGVVILAVAASAPEVRRVLRRRKRIATA
ncbi:MAG TPA: ABC transporter permease [Gemmatimonadaceae bacterium]